MGFLGEYIRTVYKSVASLLKGMKMTGYYFTHHKEIITQEYPDNRDTLILPERFRGEVVIHSSITWSCAPCAICALLHARLMQLKWLNLLSTVFTSVLILPKY